MAHKKAGGSTRNGRDLSQNDWVLNVLVAKPSKLATLLFVSAARYPGVNVGMGKDHALFATGDGFIKFEQKGPKIENTLTWFRKHGFYEPKALSYDRAFLSTLRLTETIYSVMWPTIK